MHAWCARCRWPLLLYLPPFLLRDERIQLPVAPRMAFPSLCKGTACSQCQWRRSRRDRCDSQVSLRKKDMCLGIFLFTTDWNVSVIAGAQAAFLVEVLLWLAESGVRKSQNPWSQGRSPGSPGCSPRGSVNQRVSCLRYFCDGLIVTCS
jgi:hypothetical protein